MAKTTQTSAGRASATLAPDQAVARARREVLEARDLMSKWQQQGTTHRTQLAQLQDTVGLSALDDPSSADEHAQRMLLLERQADIADRAVAAQRPRLLAAERAYLEAEADVLHAEVEHRRAQLAQHKAVTDQLLAQLSAHEGGADYVPRSDLDAATRPAHSEGPRRVPTAPRSRKMAAAITEAERPVQILRAIIAGDNPGVLLARWGLNADDVYPACVWGPDALVPADAYLDEVGRVRGLIEELEQLEATLPDQIAAFEEQARRELMPPGAVELGVARRTARLDTIPAELEELRSALAELGAGA